MNPSKSFEHASYKGTFRDYQRHLLKKLEHRLDERKLNIVTPPGSGKMVLGLELVRRIGEPCLIVSSTEVMCTQWTEQFMTCFLPESEQANPDAYLSYNLLSPSLLTSITYDTLQAAVKKGTAVCKDRTVSFEDTDIIRFVQDCGIHTILLDEPHHLNSRQTDALESFLGVLGGEFRVLILTGTPPYDLGNEDMERYLNLFGEISEEIYIPDLVKGRALCPHQDYVYFNYPTKAEASGILGYRSRVDQAVAEAVTLPFMGELGRRISKLYTRKKTDFLYNHYDAVVGILEMLYEYGHRINISEYSHLTGSKTVKPLTAEAAQNAINLLLESQTLLRDTEKDQLLELFTRHNIMEHGRVQFTLTSKVRRTLMASAGKLESIVAITGTESAYMNKDLRMMILTDESTDGELTRIGDGSYLHELNPVGIFTVLVQSHPMIPVGCMGESCAVLPNTAATALTAHGVTSKPAGMKGYSLYTFADADQKSELTAQLFRSGLIHILIGSTETLGLGWDDSFVNTLIDAATNGPFVNSHRIRGRVIHTDKSNPAKTAHIWHLVTMEHTYSAGDKKELLLASRLTADANGGLASDYRHLRRRFECYMGPNTETGELENGIERLGLKNVPRQEGMESLNSAMLARANDRTKLTSVWMNAMMDTTKPISEVRVPKKAKVPVFTAANLLLCLGSLIGFFGGVYSTLFLIRAVIIYLLFNQTLVVTVTVATILILLALTAALSIVSALFILYFLPLPISHLSASLSIRSLCRNLLKTLKDIGEINKKAVLVMETLPDKKGYRLYIDNCNHGEQIIFQKAVAEMLSPIQNPRYIFVRGGWFRRLLWRWSFACPSVISKNDVWVKVFEKYLRRSMGSMKFQYTRRDPGRKYLIFARNRSYLNTLNRPCEKRIHLLKHEREL